ncbi:MAG: hypothetical protein IK095_02165 [Oscillospiraceae bacterium]|nr:hypothetical protein [Oscillospiraceae bacterium]
MSFFDEKKIQGQLQADREKESRERADRIAAERSYAAFAKAVAPEMEQALAEFPQVARRMGKPIHREELSYFHLRRSGWQIGSVMTREDNGIAWRQIELYVAPGGALYKRDARVGSTSDEMERIDRRRAIELLTRKLWQRAKEPAPGTYEPKQIVEGYFFTILGVK